MFRPRPFRRGRVGPRVQQALRLLADGRYAEAGNLFGELADRARDNGHPLRSAQLAVQAARACLQSGDGNTAALRAQHAAQQFIAGGRPGRAASMIRNIASALRARGFDTQAQALEQDAQARLAAIGLSLERVPLEPAPQIVGALPATCPQCGGPLRADDVEWINSTSAECSYCGSTVATLRP
jgi:hypothetical protein